MKTGILKATCAVTIAVLLGGATARVAQAQFPYVPSLPFNHSSTADKVVTAVVIAATIYFIARYEADEHQRQVAGERGPQAYPPKVAGREAGRKTRKEGSHPVDTGKGQKNS